MGFRQFGQREAPIRPGADARPRAMNEQHGKTRAEIVEIGLDPAARIVKAISELAVVKGFLRDGFLF